MPFHMLIHELIAKPKENPNEKMIAGCEVFFPDTLFFERGAPKFVAHNNKDGCLSKWNDNADSNKPNAGELNSLIPEMSKIILKRKNEKKRHWLILNKMAR